MNNLDGNDYREIAENLSDIQVPDSIKPENMMKSIRLRLDDEKKKRKRKKVKMAWAAGVAVVVTLAASLALVLVNSNLNKGINSSNSNIVKDDNNDDIPVMTSDKEEINTLEGYKELALSMAEKNQDKYRMYGYGLLDGGIIIESAETEVDTSAQGGDFSETNIRTDGIDEADCVKTDGEYIYCLSSEWNDANDNMRKADMYLYIVKADGEETEIVDCHNISDDVCSQIGYDLYADIYDCRMLINDETLTVVMQMYGEKQIVSVGFYDISDKTDITNIRTVTVEGYYNTCNMRDGVFYLFVDKPIEYNYNLNEISDMSEEDAKKELAPVIDGKCLEKEDVYVAEVKEDGSYIITVTADMENPSDTVMTKAFLGSSSSFAYMCDEYIYFVSSIGFDFDEYTENLPRDKEHKVHVTGKTKIMAMEYDKGIINPYKSIVIDGHISDEFDMDYYNEYLRIAASVSGQIYTLSYTDNADFKDIIGEEIKKEGWYMTGAQWDDEAYYSTFYVLNKELDEVGRIEKLQEKESVYGVRFDGDYAYVVTYRQTDPLFTIDISDPYDPKVIGSLKIPGYSNYLHKWDENTLIGLGYDEEGWVKLSAYDISEGADVRERTVYSIEGAYGSDAVYNHRALFIAPSQGLIGFLTYEGQYKIFTYADDRFTEVISTHMYDGYEYFGDGIRGMYIDDYIYVVGAGRFIVYDISSYEEVCYLTR